MSLDEAPRRPRAVLETHRLVKTYQLGGSDVHALRGVSFVVERGDFVAIMGASGSGKSTLMHILGCLDLPTRGRYLLHGIDVRAFDEYELAQVRNRKIGFIFQSFNLIPRTSALQNVELPLVYARIKAKERRERAMDALEAVGLADRMDHHPSELSGGQQQRAAVARAIVTNPALVLADEPTGNLDSASTRDLMGLFAGLNAAGRTIVLITHEADVAAASKRVIVLHDGQVLEDRRRAPLVGPPPEYTSSLHAPAVPA